jgi:hypothetical protein
MNWKINRRIKGGVNDPYVFYCDFTGTEPEARDKCHELTDADRAAGGTVYEYKAVAA